GLCQSFLDQCDGTHRVVLRKADLSQVKERPDQVLPILHLPVILLAFFQQGTRFPIVLSADGSHAQKVEQVGQVPSISSRAGERTPLRKQEAHLVIVAVPQGKPAQPQQGCRQRICLPRLFGRSIQRQALLTQRLCSRAIAQEKGQPGSSTER